MLMASLGAGFYDLFSTFSQYDDEGFWLIATRLFQQGHTLYDDIFIPYGPVSIAVKQLLHDVLQIPVTNSAVRLVSLFYWVMLSAICGLSTYRITDSAWWGLVTYGVVFALMRVFTNEPGHPQELVACFAALIPLLLCITLPPQAWLSWFMTGALIALIIATKINIGGYCLAAVLVVIAAELPRSRWRNALQIAAVLCSATFPFVLMLPHMQQTGCLPYAVICAATLSAAAIALFSPRSAGSLSLRIGLVAIAGMAVAILLTFIWMSVNGSTLPALVDSVLYFASGLQYAYFFRHYSNLQIGFVLVAPLFAALLVWIPLNRFRHYSIAAGKLLFVGLTVFALAANDQANAHFMLAWAGPWCWLCALQINHPKASVARKMLALLAAWHLLLAYPIAGSQLYFGTFLVAVSAVVCLADVTHWLANSVKNYSAQQRQLLSVAPAALLASLSLLFLTGKAFSLKQEYAALQPLNVQGTRFIRLAPERVAFYQYVVAEMRQADVGFTSSGFNSLYFWSGVAMPAPVVVQHDLRLSSEKDRRAVIQGLAAARHPLVLLRLPAYGIEPPKIDVTDWIKSEFEVYRRYHGYALMKRKSG